MWCCLALLLSLPLSLAKPNYSEEQPLEKCSYITLILIINRGGVVVELPLTRIVGFQVPIKSHNDSLLSLPSSYAPSTIIDYRSVSFKLPKTWPIISFLPTAEIRFNRIFTEVN